MTHKNSIRQLREERGWSRNDLAERVGGSAQWIYLLEAGSIRLMPKHVPIFCAIFGVKPAELGFKRPKSEPDVPASYLDMMAETVVEAAVAKSGLTGKQAQALRQQLRYAAAKAKLALGIKRR